MQIKTLDQAINNCSRFCDAAILRKKPLQILYQSCVAAISFVTFVNSSLRYQLDFFIHQFNESAVDRYVQELVSLHLPPYTSLLFFCFSICFEWACRDF